MYLVSVDAKDRSNVSYIGFPTTKNEILTFLLVQTKIQRLCYTLSQRKKIKKQFCFFKVYNKVKLFTKTVSIQLLVNQ